MKNKERIGQKAYNSQGCLMCIVEYNDAKNIIVEFQDNYRGRVHTAYSHFVSGRVRNPYHPSVYGIGMTGNKYSININNKPTKEYGTWKNMLSRCFDVKFKDKRPTYQNVTCCDEWLLFENFYEWLHSQDNFNRWYNNDGWHLDKDILVKGNKIYSPETCCLVPFYVNALFGKNNAIRGCLPIGVSTDIRDNGGFQAKCKNPFLYKAKPLGTHLTIEQAFYTYKEYKENLIKQIAINEYSKGNITKKCYVSMINYEVEITD